MRGSVVFAGALLGAVSLIGLPASAQAAPDPYSGGVQTSCRVSVPPTLEPGQKVVVTVSVEANSATPPRGDIDLSINTAPGGDNVFQKTVPYNGGDKRIVGPKLQGGDYEVVARFRPGNDDFLRCRGHLAFEVQATGDERDPDDAGDDNGPGGLLPDTGGPALLWLLLGTTLVGGGAATVVYARRRTDAAAA